MEYHSTQPAWTCFERILRARQRAPTTDDRSNEAPVQLIDTAVLVEQCLGFTHHVAEHDQLGCVVAEQQADGFQDRQLDSDGWLIMHWTHDEPSIAIELAILESIRLLLGDDTSQLIMLSDVMREAQALLNQDSRIDQLNRSFIASIIRGWRTLPSSEYALEASPSRLSAVIFHHRGLGRSSTESIMSRFLPALGTTAYLDRCTDPVEWWQNWEGKQEH